MALSRCAALVPAVEVGDKLVICLASTLNLDGTPSSATFDAVSCRHVVLGWRQQSCGQFTRCHPAATGGLAGWRAGAHARKAHQAI